MAETLDVQTPDPQISAAFEQLSKLEVDFAHIELDARMSFPASIPRTNTDATGQYGAKNISSDPST